MIKRLAGQTGTIIDAPITENDSEDRLVRPAILVHEGSFESQDGEISFDEPRIKRIVENHNSMILKLAQQYGGIEKMPPGAYPPILDQHGDDSGHRVQGRLASLLRFEKRDIPGVGLNIACAMADIVFLGRDTVAKVMDGRIYHLSVGIEESTDTLAETSTVIEPACPGAMVLKKAKAIQNNKEMKGGTKMSADLKTKGPMAVWRAELSAIKKELGVAVKTLSKTNDTVKLERKKTEVIGGFKRLMASGKMTPAEFKNMNITELSALDDKSRKTIMSTFEAREPVIIPGQKGSTQAVTFSDIGKTLESVQLKRLASEIKNDFTRMTGGKKMKLSEGTAINTHDEKDPEKKVKDTGTHVHELEKEVKEEHEKASKDSDTQKDLAEGEDAATTPDASKLDTVQAQVDELNTQVARIAGMVDQLMNNTKDEEDDSRATPSEAEPAIVAATAAN